MNDRRGDFGERKISNASGVSALLTTTATPDPCLYEFPLFLSCICEGNLLAWRSYSHARSGQDQDTAELLNELFHKQGLSTPTLPMYLDSKSLYACMPLDS